MCKTYESRNFNGYIKSERRHKLYIKSDNIHWKWCLSNSAISDMSLPWSRTYGMLLSKRIFLHVCHSCREFI